MQKVDLALVPADARVRIFYGVTQKKLPEEQASFRTYLPLRPDIFRSQPVNLASKDEPGTAQRVRAQSVLSPHRPLESAR